MTDTTKILVTGATGNVGRHVVSQLLEAGTSVRALTRDPASARLPGAVEVVRGSQLDPAGLEEHLDGVGAVFLVLPGFDRVDLVRESVRAIAKHAERVVFLSSAAVRDDGDEQDGVIARAHATIERDIAGSGVAWTFLRPYGFATNVLPWGRAIRAGEPVRLVFPEVPVTAIDERDIAAVAVRALTEAGHASARYELTGPELLTPVERLAVIGDITGHRPGWTELPAEEWLGTVLGPRAVPDEAAIMRERFERMRTHPAPVTDTVRRVTGRPARTFRDWVSAHAAELAGTLPEPRRDDAGFVLVSTWRVADPGLQRAAAGAALGDWEKRAWPRGLLAHSVLLGTDGHTVLQYSQWTDEEAVEEFRRTDRPTRNADIDAEVPGIERIAATGYRLYRSAVPDRALEPGVIVLVSFRTESAEIGENFVDALVARHPAANGGEVPAGMRANHFHIAVDGTAALNYAEFADEEAHQRVVDSSLRENDDVPTLIANTPGLTPLGFRRYLPYGTAHGRTN